MTVCGPKPKFVAAQQFVRLLGAAAIGERLSVPQLSILNFNIEALSCNFGVANSCIWQQVP
jgi:hypothetical protein